MKQFEQYWINVNELENDGDRLYRTFLADLFDGGLDALTVMKFKHIADELEETVDAFTFTNGFHDSANAIATSVSTRALTAGRTRNGRCR